MPVPEFILTLREKIGHDLLWLTGVTAVVLDDEGRVLLVRRSDSGAWAPVSGILEPGEQPAVAAVREVLEETGVVASAERLSSTASETEPTICPNGDLVQFVDLTFRCRYLSGRAHVGDDESTDVGWFALDALPPMAEHLLARIDAAVHGGPGAEFENEVQGADGSA